MLNTSDTLNLYTQDPSPDNLSNVVASLNPTINYALISVNGANDPVLKSEAKLIAANAVKSYDPA
jgi:hypothetical protein